MKACFGGDICTLKALLCLQVIHITFPVLELWYNDLKSLQNPAETSLIVMYEKIGYRIWGGFDLELSLVLLMSNWLCIPIHRIAQHRTGTFIEIKEIFRNYLNATWGSCGFCSWLKAILSRWPYVRYSMIRLYSLSRTMNLLTPYFNTIRYLVLPVGHLPLVRYLIQCMALYRVTPPEPANRKAHPKL